MLTLRHAPAQNTIIVKACRSLGGARFEEQRAYLSRRGGFPVAVRKYELAAGAFLGLEETKGNPRRGGLLQAVRRDKNIVIACQLLCG